MLSGIKVHIAFSAHKESCMQVPPWVKPGFWSGVIGALGIMIIGFGWLGWTWAAPQRPWHRTG